MNESPPLGVPGWGTPVSGGYSEPRLSLPIAGPDLQP